MTGQHKKKSLAARGWLPNQHGAWAMLTVPLVVGAVLAGRSSVGPAAWLIPLAIAEFAGYFAFNALGLWLHARPGRRAAFHPPMIAYGVLTGLAAIAVLALGGMPLLGWLPAAVVLAGSAIWLSSRKQDRSVASGLITTAMAVGVGLVVRFPAPASIVGDRLATGADLAVFIALFGYYAGTVWHVKSLIRKWGDPVARRNSALWHLVFLVLAVAASITHLLSVGWPAFFTLCLARTWWLSSPNRTKRPKPLQIGLLEMGMSVLALVIAIV